MPEFDPSKPATTRDGRKVKVLTTFTNPNGDRKLAVLIECTAHGSGMWFASYNISGRIFDDRKIQSSADLINIPRRFVFEEVTQLAHGAVPVAFEGNLLHLKLVEELK